MSDKESSEPHVVDLSPKNLSFVETCYGRLLEWLASLPSCEEEAPSREHRALWSAASELSELLELAYVPADLDLTRANDEYTIAALGAFIRWRHFTPQPMDDPGVIHVPEHSAIDCKLEVYYQHGRYLATWLKLEEAEPEARECDLRELLCFQHVKEDRRLILVEVA